MARTRHCGRHAHPRQRGTAAAPDRRSARGGSRLIGFWPLAAYLVALLALFVRFVDPETLRPQRHLMASEEDLRLVRRHHAVFYTLLLAGPVEWYLRGRPAGWGQLIGAAVLVLGVVGYRRAGRALGDQLSPLVAPSEPAELVERGPYRRLRHPMYLAELAIAFGAPATLAARLTMLLSVLFTVLVIRRIGIEERVLGARLADYHRYAARTYRLVPYVY